MYILGIDVGKQDLHARLLHQHNDQADPMDQPRSFPNTPPGHLALLTWLTRCTADGPNTRVVMEATGVYWERVAVALFDQQYTVCVVNPAQVKFFAKSTLRRGKTDAMDAEGLRAVRRHHASCTLAPHAP